MNAAIISQGRILFARANSKKIAERRAVIRAEVEARYESVIRRAGFFSRWMIRAKIQIEVVALLRAELPSGYTLFSRR